MHHPGAHCFRDGVEDRRQVGMGDRGERPRRELAPEYGGHADQRTGRLVERGELPEHNATNTGGKTSASPCRAVSATGANVERIATAGVEHPVEQQLAGLFAQRHGQQLPDVQVGERRDLHTRRESRQLAKIGSTRLVSGSKRCDQQQWTARSGRRDVSERLQRRRISPLQVLDDHHGRPGPRCRGHHRRELVQKDESVRRSRSLDPCGGPRPRADEREHINELGGQTTVVGFHRPQHLDPGPERRCHVALPAPSPVHPDSIRLGGCRQLHRQAGLPDPGRPRNDERTTGSALRPSKRTRQFQELPLPTDEAVRDHARSLPFAAVRVDRTTVRTNRTPLAQNIPVTEVEAALHRCPKIREVAVSGYPDDRLGERSCAVVVPNDGETIALDDLTLHLHTERMAKHYWPERLELRDSLPQTASGKIQKFVLRREIATGHP